MSALLRESVISDSRFRALCRTVGHRKERDKNWPELGRDGGRSRSEIPATEASEMQRLSAVVLVAAPFVLALVAGSCGIWQLHDTVTFERRAIHLVGLRAGTLRLQLDADSGVRDFAVTRRPAALALYRTNEAALADLWAALHAGAIDMNVTGGPGLVTVMERLNAKWNAAVAQPLIRGALRGDRMSKARREDAGHLDEQLLNEYRHESDRFVFAIAARIRRDIDSTESQLLRIGVLFALAVTLCGVSIGFAARRQVAISRARIRAETLLREREILLEQSRSSSRAFQRAILPPHLPSVAGCSFDAVYEAGNNDAQVGGDWYDAVQLRDGRILVSIGDVAGSGLEAAVVMGIVRQIMRGIAQVHANPALMLDAADRALQLEYADVFVTAWVGVIDLVTRTVTYASAGHPPPLLADADGSVRELGETALPLGLRQGHQAAPATVAITDGSTLVLYTDGLSEATRDVLVGREKVAAATRHVAATCGPHPATEIARRVLTGRATDDVAILVIRMNLAEAERSIERASFPLDAVDAAHAARDAFIEQLARCGHSAPERFNAELVFGELIANVVRHAKSSASIEIAVDRAGPQVVLHVLDRGPGFRHISRLPSDPYSETGRGLFLIAAMTDDFSVAERPDGGSHARAVFRSSPAQTLDRQLAIV